jgi:hypothetical protein
VLLVGTASWIELVAGACGAALAAALAAAVRRQELLAFRLERLWLARAWSVPLRIVRDFAVLTWALLLHVTRARPVRGRFVAVPFPAGGDDEAAAGRRGVAALLGSIAPNTIVVDVDTGEELALKHDLVPGRASKTVP